MDSLYYEEGCPCCHGFKDAAEGIRFSPDVLSDFMRKIYDGFDTASDIEPTIWRETLRLMNEATVEGLSRADAPPTHEDDFYQTLRHSNEVFAAFKVHTMGEQMASKLTTTDGRLKPFRQWAEDVRSITSHHVGSWLQTEYNTAVLRAHAAADWRQAERDKDILPNLRWMPTTSPEPENTHRQYWQKELTLPVDHPFWDKHHPGDRWNCKCALEQTDEPANPEVLNDMDETKPGRGLENNPGKDGHTFNDTHPYFPEKCNQCFAYKKSGFKNRLKSLFANRIKDCYNCSFINNAMKEASDKIKNTKNILPPNVETYIPSHNGMVLTSPYHGSNEVEENKRLGAFIAKKIGKKVFLLPRLDPKDKDFAHLRDTLLPRGVMPNKNPDYYIGGLFFDGKSMMRLQRSGNKKKYHNAILNHIKTAKKQADNVILEIPTFVSRKVIGTTIKGYLKQSSKSRLIIIKHGNKCYVYK